VSQCSKHLDFISCRFVEESMDLVTKGPKFGWGGPERAEEGRKSGQEGRNSAVYGLDHRQGPNRAG
jgi:hypothetical protein